MAAAAGMSPPVKPPNADGYVNWLDTLFENNLGHAGANRLDIRIDQVNSHNICRIDIPASSRPIWVKNKRVPTPSTSAATTQPDKYQPTRPKPSSPNDSDSKNQGAPS